MQKLEIAASTRSDSKMKITSKFGEPDMLL